MKVDFQPIVARVAANMRQKREHLRDGEFSFKGVAWGKFQIFRVHYNEHKYERTGH